MSYIFGKLKLHQFGLSWTNFSASYEASEICLHLHFYNIWDWVIWITLVLQRACKMYFFYECKEKSQFQAPWSGGTIGPKTKYDLVLSAPPRLNNRFYSPDSFCKLNFVHFVKNIRSFDNRFEVNWPPEPTLVLRWISKFFSLAHFLVIHWR